MFRLCWIFFLSGVLLGQTNSVNKEGATAVPGTGIVSKAVDSSVTSLDTSAAKSNKSDSVAAVSPSETIITIHGLCSDSGIGVASSDNSSCTTRIRKEEFDVFVEALRASGQRMPPDLTPELRRTIAQTYVETFTFEEAGRKAGLDQDPKFLAAMKGFRLILLSRMYQYHLEQEAKKVAPAEIEKYYNDNIAKFEQLELVHIVFPMNNPTNLKDEEFHHKAELLAQELRDRLAQGEDADKLEKEGFEKLGQKSPPSTNLVPARRAQYSTEQEKELFSLKAGEVTPLIKLPSVYVAYKLISRRTIPLAEATDEISLQIAGDNIEKKTKAIQESVHADYDTRYFGPPPRTVKAVSKAASVR